MPTFSERHGLRACMVAPTKIIAGLGMSLGIDRLDAPGTTGEPPPLHPAGKSPSRESVSLLCPSGQNPNGETVSPLHP